MADFTITVPNDLVPPILAGLRELGYTGTDLQVAKAAIRVLFKEAYSHYRLHNDNTAVIQAVDDAVVVAQEAYEAAQQARKDAEIATHANIKADFQGLS